ncbi:YncE family protein [Desulfosporosinus sp. BG]|uniref:YncE family protein n=1 Tax=Desulfosporosinus sp. BG TaxID=1633135 RepID=UPI00083A998D|nr:YncE family protein [Desulfosporosinus sp. BG]ODA39529.1 collagen triple helix repeat domain protein [Desulfosporosinus sp. BG]
MSLLITGLIRNTEVLGVRPSSTLFVRIANDDMVSSFVQIRGFYLTGTTNTEYVFDVVTLAPGGVSNNSYYAQFDAFEFKFITSSDAVEISAWGRDDSGALSVVYQVHPVELNLFGSMEGVAGADGSTISSAVKRIYIANSRSNNVSIIDAESKVPIGTVKVGSRPFGVGVNPITNRVYVTNQGSDNVSVIDGFSNVVIATIKVGLSPESVDVDPKTNKIYITNAISNNISVINGSTNTVIATLTKEVANE